MARSVESLDGLRVLVVEDNFLAAELIRGVLEGIGCAVVGPVGHLEDGLRLAQAEALDGAVLDINLHGDRCFPIAEALRERNVPFLFLTGYDDGSIIPIDLRRTPRLGKPIAEHALVEALGRLIAY